MSQNTKTNPKSQLTVRLPNELIDFLRDHSRETCNSKGGIVQLALKTLRESLEQQKSA